MVKSKINKKIVYEEDFEVDYSDLNHETDIYELNIVKLHRRVNIILGKKRKEYLDDKIISFHIYLVNKEYEVEKCIGIFEMTMAEYDIFKTNENH